MVVAVVALVAFGSSRSFAGPGGTAPPAPSDASHFNHADHKKRGVDTETCQTCHKVHTDGTVATPAASGHAPCLSAGCHATWFVASGPKAKQQDPAMLALHDQAARFCRGCHVTTTSDGPSPWLTTKAENAFTGATTEYHSKLPHFDHTGRAACRDCHIVDPKSFKLRADAPGHPECARCHDGKKAHEMARCDGCHEPPAAEVFFDKERPNSDVRSCGGAAFKTLAAQAKGATPPCYKHERQEHRFRKDGSPLQCGSCHYMIADQNVWGAYSYDTLYDLKRSPIIDNTKDRAHKACGQSGCHAADVVDSKGTARCALCHSSKVLDTLFGP